MRVTWFFIPFIVTWISDNVHAEFVPTAIVVANEGTDEHVTTQMVCQFGDFLFVVVFVKPSQTINLNAVVEVPNAKRGEESYQLNRG